MSCSCRAGRREGLRDGRKDGGMEGWRDTGGRWEDDTFMRKLFERAEAAPANGGRRSWPSEATISDESLSV